MSLGEKLLQARKAKGLGQKDVAEAIGVTVQAVSQWERDKTAPGPVNLVNLSSYLGLSLDHGHIPLREFLSTPSSGISVPIVDDFPTIYYKDQDDPEADANDWFVEGRLSVDWTPVGNVFAKLVNDRSMAPTFMPGDVLIFDAGLTIEPGDFVMAHAYPQALFRKFRLVGHNPSGQRVIDLVPVNQDYPTVQFVENETGEISGCLREHRRFFKEK